MKRRGDVELRAGRRLALIEESITLLQNDDLVDLADIFKCQQQAPLAELASIEMEKRNISL